MLLNKLWEAQSINIIGFIYIWLSSALKNYSFGSMTAINQLHLAVNQAVSWREQFTSVWQDWRDVNNSEPSWQA